MGNTLSASNTLFATYCPVNQTSLEAVITARKAWSPPPSREQTMSKTWNAPGRKVGTAQETAAKPLKNGGSDGTRTRGLRRDRPAL